MKRKVLFFRPSLGDGGADRVTSLLLRHLDRNKFEVAIALLRADGPFMADVPADVRIHVLGSRRLALSAPALRNVIRRERPDVVFSTASSANVIAVVAHALANTRARLILSERSSLFRDKREDFKQHALVALKRFAYRRAHVVTAVSAGVADELVSTLGLRRDAVHVVYNPMVDDELSTRAAEPVEHPWFAPGEPPVIVACSRLIGLKDYPSILEAFAKIRARMRARLFVLGEGPLKEQLRERARRLGIADDVCFYGFDKNPMKYMSRAQVFMHASRVEGLPGSVIQSMACGTPVVATDCDYGTREVIATPSVDGFLVPVGDVDALAMHALRLLEDATLRDKIGAAGRASVNRFSAQSSMARYEAALEV